MNCTVGPLGREILTFEQEFPREKGDYKLIGELVTVEGNVVRSLRDFKIVSAEEYGDGIRFFRPNDEGENFK